MLGTDRLKTFQRQREEGRLSTKEEAIEVEAMVVEPLPNAMFRVEVELERQQAPGPGAHLGEDAEALHPHPARRPVLVELSPYDLNRGRIVYRLK